VKAALRKKGGALADSTQPPSHVKKPKRKRSLNSVAEAKNMPAHDEDELLRNPVKRRKKFSEAANPLVQACPSQASVTPPTPSAVKRYNGKKVKVTPASADTTTVNCDRVPNTPSVAAVPCDDVIVETQEIRPRMLAKVQAKNTAASALSQVITDVTDQTSPRLSEKLDISYDADLLETGQVLHQPEADDTFTTVCDSGKDSTVC
jgi:hypothetical protein